MAQDTGFHLTPLGNGWVLLEPQHGINPADPGPSIESILKDLGEQRLTRLYYDLSGVVIIDPVYYAFLNRFSSACQAVGIAMICINMQPHTAFALAGHMEESPRFATARGIGEPTAAWQENGGDQSRKFLN